MILNKDNFTPCFHLLRSVLFEAFQLETLYFVPPYENLAQIDQGLRNIIWPDFDFRNKAFIPSAEDPYRRFFVVRSNLGFYNIIIYLDCKAQPDFISVGPFCSDDLSPDYFHHMQSTFKITDETMFALQGFYSSVPSAPLQSVINITKHILCTFYPFFEECSPIYVEFADNKSQIQLDQQSLLQFTSEFSENYQETLFRFLETLSKGQFEVATSCLKDFLRISKILNDRNLNNCKQNLHFLNSCCHLVLMHTNVHPLHIFKLFTTMRIRIDSVNNREQLLNLPNELCHKYCLLVKNYAFPDYSKTIRSVVNYIHMHMDEDLTLAMIAKEFNKNASSLSASFSKEVGISITNYIHQVRINEAIKLFNTTKMSISEAAFAVGFHDFAYFSRLFHKQVGCSPRDYCKSIR